MDTYSSKLTNLEAKMRQKMSDFWKQEMSDEEWKQQRYPPQGKNKNKGSTNERTQFFAIMLQFMVMNVNGCIETIRRDYLHQCGNRRTYGKGT